jgi:hypothetical protein
MDLAIVFSVAYGAAIFVTAWTTGKRDGMNNFLFDTGFLIQRRRTIKGIHKTDIFEKG